VTASLGVNRLGRWRLSILLGILACLIRELALPYIVAMAAFALYERRYRELVGWTAGAVLFCAAYAWHLSIASTLSRPGDHHSAGWLYFGGWPFVLETAKRNVALIHAPNVVIAAVVCLGIIGLAGYRDRLMSRAALILGGYIVSFLFIGRPDIPYWGLLYAPLLPIGVALSPLAVRDLIARSWAPRPAPRALIALERIWRETAARVSAALRNWAAPALRRLRVFGNLGRVRAGRDLE